MAPISAECPICLESYSGPIFLCQNGHSLCGRCTTRVNQCPTCRGPMTKIRNFGLEAILAESAQKGFKKEILALKIIFTLSVLLALAFSLQSLNSHFRQGQDEIDLKLQKLESILTTLKNLDWTLEDPHLSIEILGLIKKNFVEKRMEAAALLDQLPIDDSLKAKLEDPIQKLERSIQMKIQEKFKNMDAKLADYRALVHELSIYKPPLTRALSNVYQKISNNALIQFCSIVYDKIAGFFQFIASPFE